MKKLFSARMEQELEDSVADLDWIKDNDPEFFVLYKKQLLASEDEFCIAEHWDWYKAGKEAFARVILKEAGEGIDQVILESCESELEGDKDE